MSDKIRGMIRKRRKIYDREGRSRRWKKLKKKTANLIKQRASVYMENQKLVLTAHDASRSFFKNVKAYQSKEKPKEFDPRDLFPGASDKEVADGIAQHFNAISSEFRGLSPEDVPVSVDLDLGLLSPEAVAKRMREMKKPKSKVRGDIFPALINRASAMIAPVLTKIYNTITSTGEWPLLWKTEYVTPIPKKTRT